MTIHKDAISIVGDTPLIDLSSMCEGPSARLLGKAEYLNPSGSVKDRLAAYTIEQAELNGLIKPGAIIVEATAGNTGLSLAMVAAIKGYRCILVVPDKFSSEKINMLKAYGAEVVITPTHVGPDHPENWLVVARRIVEETPNAFYANQFYNDDNWKAHYLTTGPEIWEQTKGEVDLFVLGAGSGGTLTGAGRYLKEQAAKAGKDLKIVCPDPIGSAFYDTFYKNEDALKQGYKVEGMGNDFIPGTLDLEIVDEMMRVGDREAFLTARRVTRELGLFVGGTSGVNVAAAIKIAKVVGPGKTVVTILCDSGDRYISKMYNDEWMKDFGYLGLNERLGTVHELLQFTGCNVEFANGEETVESVASRMSALGISQMPVKGDDSRPPMMIHEVDLLQSLLSEYCSPGDAVHRVAAPLQGQVGLTDPVSELEHIFDENNVAVVMDNQEVVGIVSKIDVVKFLASRS
ncbi:hypothetical protein BVY02_00555 [bacterium J17]|nr:hypothetical protein BVY02_00555 [bacterium J17]